MTTFLEDIFRKRYICSNCQKEILKPKIVERETSYIFLCPTCFGLLRIKEKDWAKFKHKNGKIYLNRPDWKGYKEVEVKGGFTKKGESFLKVVPREKNLLPLDN